MQEFKVGVFATLGQEYDPEVGKYKEKIFYSVHHWCDEKGVNYHREDGLHLVTIHTFVFDEGQGVAREAVIRTMVEGLRSKKASIQADAQAQVMEIEKQINRLLALPAPQADGSEWEVV